LSKKIRGAMETSRQLSSRKWLWRGLALAAALLAAAFAYIAWPRPVPQPPPVPNPNGYDDFLHAAESLLGDASLDIQKASADELRQLSKLNRKPLELVRTGLTRECGVAIVSYSQERDAVRLEQINKMRQLGRLLFAEGRLAELEGRPADAARGYVDAVRFSHEMARGGLIIDLLVGIAMEGTAIEALHSLRNELGGAQCEKAITELEAIEADREPLERVFQRDHDSSEARIAELGWTAFKARSTLRRMARIAEEPAHFAEQRRQAAARLLLIELAIRRYTTEHGRLPERLNELVPGQISAIPNDPFIEEGFRYQRTEDGYRLYSIGPNRKDDGGTGPDELSARGRSEGDFFLGPARP